MLHINGLSFFNQNVWCVSSFSNILIIFTIFTSHFIKVFQKHQFCRHYIQLLMPESALCSKLIGIVDSHDLLCHSAWIPQTCKWSNNRINFINFLHILFWAYILFWLYSHLQVRVDHAAHSWVVESIPICGLEPKAHSSGTQAVWYELSQNWMFSGKLLIKWEVKM